MRKTTITPLPDPSGFSSDPLTDILRSGARRLIERAVEAELSALLSFYADEKMAGLASCAMATYRSAR